VEQLKGRTASFIDNSGSMTSRTISKMSTVTPKDIAGIMGALVSIISDESFTGVFADRFATVNINNMGIIDRARKISGTDVGGSTYAYHSIKFLNDNKIFVDRIIILSDEQCYSEYDHYGNDSTNSQTLYGQFILYKRTINPNVKLYSINLCGYGTSNFPEKMKGVVLLGGWSDRILQFIRVYEDALESKAFLSAIDKYGN